MKSSLEEPISLSRNEYIYELNVLEVEFEWDLDLKTPCPKTVLSEQPLASFTTFVVVGGSQTEPITQEISVFKDYYADTFDINGVGCGGQTLTIEVDGQLI